MFEENLRQKAQEHLEAREDSFQRSDTDGFVSQWCHGLQALLCDELARIDENEGTANFLGLYVRESGKRVRAKLVNTKFGSSWAFCDAEGKFTGRFLPHSKGTPRSRIFQEGFETRLEAAPAHARLADNGGGLSSVFVLVYRTDGGYPPDAVGDP